MSKPNIPAGQITQSNSVLMSGMIAIGVFISHDEYRQRGVPTVTDVERAEMIAVISGGGDTILYKGKDTAKNMAMLTKAIALLSTVPGGVDFDGMHFEYDPSPPLTNG